MKEKEEYTIYSIRATKNQKKKIQEFAEQLKTTIPNAIEFAIDKYNKTNNSKEIVDVESYLKSQVKQELRKIIKRQINEN